MYWIEYVDSRGDHCFTDYYNSSEAACERIWKLRNEGATNIKLKKPGDPRCEP